MLNLKRGFLRIWLVSTVLFMAYIFAQGYGSIQSEFDDQARVEELRADGGLGVPVPCDEAARRQMGKENLAFTSVLSGTKSCYYPFSKVRKFWPEYAGRPDRELMKDLYRDAGDRLSTGEPFLLMLRIAAFGMIPSLAVLALGWAVAGFAGASRRPA
jgi:hypothetical protein